jgi:hypothetical protein
MESNLMQAEAGPVSAFGDAPLGGNPESFRQDRLDLFPEAFDFPCETLEGLRESRAYPKGIFLLADEGLEKGLACSWIGLGFQTFHRREPHRIIGALETGNDAFDDGRVIESF